jgi:hypothetical protein
MTRLDVNAARRGALFASGLQRSDAPTAAAVAEAISRTVRQFGIGGCVSLMAQEFGDHPEAARDRMRWVWQLVGDVPATRRTGQSGTAPVRSSPDAARPAADGARRAA